MLLKSPYLSGIHTEIGGETTRHLGFKTQQLKIKGKSVMGVQKAGRREGGREGERGEEKRFAAYRTKGDKSCVCGCAPRPPPHIMRHAGFSLTRA